MPRISRVVAVGYPHHVTQRGNYRQSVFDSETDYLHYLQWLNDYSRKYSLKIRKIGTATICFKKAYKRVIKSTLSKSESLEERKMMPLFFITERLIASLEEKRGQTAFIPFLKKRGQDCVIALLKYGK